MEIDGAANVLAKRRLHLSGEIFDAYVLLPFPSEVRGVKLRVNDRSQATMEGNMIVGVGSEIEARSKDWAKVLKLAEHSGVAPSVAIEDTRFQWPGWGCLFSVHWRLRQSSFNQRVIPSRIATVYRLTTSPASTRSIPKR